MLIRMKKIKWTGLAMLVVGAIGFIVTFKNPFGFVFWSSVSLFWLSCCSLLFIFSYQLYQGKGVRKLLSSLIFIVSLLVLVTYILIISDTWTQMLRFQKNLSSEEWTEDIAALESLMSTKHPGYFIGKNDSSVRLACSSLKRSLIGKSSTQTKLELLKIIAQLNDGHSFIQPFQPSLGLHFFPLETYWFGQDLYILNADARSREIVGGRITMINKTKINDVYTSVAKYIGAENDMHRKFRFALYGLCGELLKNEGIISDEKILSLSVELNGVVKEWSIPAQPAYAWLFWYFKPWQLNERDLLPQNFALFRKKFWYEVLDQDIVYLQWNLISNDREETVEQLAESLNRTLRDPSIQFLVIDLRNNLGGNNTLLPPMLEVIKKNEHINRPDHLFVITGRKTYSAAVNLLALLENQTEAIFVGEPSGEGPNLYGDNRSYILPNSGISVNLSSKYWQGGMPEDKRSQYVPLILVEETVSDYRLSKDKALEAVQNFIREKKKGKKIDLSQPSPLQVVKQQVFEFSPYQDVIIDEHESGTIDLFITDYSKSNLFEVSKRLFRVSPNSWESKVTPVSIHRSGAELVDLAWFDTDRSLKTRSGRLPLAVIIEGNISEARKLIKPDLSNLPPNAESSINRIGYSFIAKESFAKAIEVFVLNTELFPKSANTFDSLGEAYNLAGDPSNAKRSYSKALELNPDLISSKKALESLD